MSRPKGLISYSTEIDDDIVIHKNPDFSRPRVKSSALATASLPLAYQPWSRSYALRKQQEERADILMMRRKLPRASPPPMLTPPAWLAEPPVTQPIVVNVGTQGNGAAAANWVDPANAYDVPYPGDDYFRIDGDEMKRMDDEHPDHPLVGPAYGWLGPYLPGREPPWAKYKPNARRRLSKWIYRGTPHPSWMNPMAGRTPRYLRANVRYHGPQNVDWMDAFGRASIRRPRRKVSFS